MHAKFYPLKKLFFALLMVVGAYPFQAGAQTYANSQVNGVTGLCLLCSVSNPNNPVNNSSLTDYSTFNITAGLLGVTIYQTLIFPSASSSCDSLVIEAGSGNSVLSINLFGGVTVQTYNGSTDNGDSHVADSSIVHLVQSNTQARIVLHPTHTFDRVKLTLSSSLLGLLNSFRIYYAYRNAGVPSAPAFNVPEGLDCGTHLLPILHPEPGIQYAVNLHYTDFFGTDIFDTAYTLVNDTVIKAPETYDIVLVTKNIYVQAINPFTGCRSDTVHHAFLEGGYGAYPTVDADSLHICFGDSVTLHAYIPGYITPAIFWYDAVTGGTLVHTGNYFTVKPDTNITYYVTSNLGCTYPVRRPVKITVSKLASPAYSVPEGFYCGNAVLTVTNFVAGLNYLVSATYVDQHDSLLYDTAFTVVNNDSIPLRNLYSFFTAVVSVSVQAIDTAGCRSDTVTQELVFGPYGAYPAVDHDSVSICVGDSAIVHAYEPNGSTAPQILWYSAATGGTLLHTGYYDTVSPPVTTTYYVTARLACEYPVRRPVKVIVLSCMSNDQHGKTSQPSVISDPLTEELTVFPNPTSGTVHIASRHNLNGATIVITDLQGREIRRIGLNDTTFALDTGTGLYVIKVILKDGEALPVRLLLKQ